MKFVKGLVAVLLFVTALVAVQRFCWIPYRCEIAKKTADARLRRAFGLGDSSLRSSVGLSTLEQLEPFLETRSADPELLVLVGMASDAAGWKDRRGTRGLQRATREVDVTIPNAGSRQ